MLHSVSLKNTGLSSKPLLRRTDKYTSSSLKNSDSQINAVVGLIPSYSVMDLSLKYTYKKIQIETGINNINNASYFTRRAVAYPGPGIIPSMPRNFYICLQIKI